MKKRKSDLLRQIYLLLLMTVVASTLVTGTIYMLTSAPVFVKEKAGEILPRAEMVAEYYRQYSSGERTLRDFQSAIAFSGTLSKAQLQIYNANGEMIICSLEMGEGFSHRANSQFMIDLVSPTAQKVLQSGEEAVEYNKAPGESTEYLSVGVPVSVDGQANAVVVLTTPMSVLRAPLHSLNKVLVFSILVVYLLLLIPAYFAVRRATQPIRQMRDVALSMAKGDFTARADEGIRGEIGELAQAFNYLAERLGDTVRALTIERNRLRQVLDGLAEGILATNALGEITHTNPAMYELFDTPQGAFDALHEALRHSDERLMDELTGVSQTQQQLVRHIQTPTRMLRMIASPIQNEMGACQGVVALFHDITESERLEQTRRDYVANVSHELRTPLSAVRGLTEALNDGLIKTPEDQARYYGYILRECMRLTRLINDLLELSRLQSGSVAFQKEPLLLMPLLEDVQMRYATMADDLDIHFEVEVRPDCPVVCTNGDRVEQVLVVLLDNAFKFTQEEGTVRVFVDWDETRVRVHVQDTGCGIAKEDLPYVFDRFYKAEKAHSGGGTGLGLSIASEIMSLMGEKIWAESEAGSGTTFTFTLRRAADVAAKREADKDAQNAKEEGCTDTTP